MIYSKEETNEIMRKKLDLIILNNQNHFLYQENSKRLFHIQSMNKKLNKKMRFI